MVIFYSVYDKEGYGVMVFIKENPLRSEYEAFDLLRMQQIMLWTTLIVGSSISI